MIDTPEVIQGPMSTALQAQGTQAVATSETATAAAAAQARASVEAAYVIAYKRPRSIDQVRERLLHACRRPSFANEAIYSKPVGSEYNEQTQAWEKKIVEDLSIRFAEEAARHFRNLNIGSMTLWDDHEKRIVSFTVDDLEENVHWSKTITVEKRVEKKKLRRNQRAVSSRVNSYGETVYLVDATTDEIQKREAAEGSKAWRTLILKLIPADVKEECKELCYTTMANKAASDPDGEKKKILDGFASLGVQPVHLIEYLDGQELTTLQPAQIVELRKLFTTIRDGEMTWAGVMAQKEELRQNQEAEKAAEKGKPKTFDEAAERAREARASTKPREAEPPSSQRDVPRQATPVSVKEDSKGEREIQLELIRSMAARAHVTTDVVAGWFSAQSLEALDPGFYEAAIEELQKTLSRR